MTRAGGTGSAPSGAPCSHTPLREQRGDSTGFVASEEVRTLPEVSLPSLSTPPRASVRPSPSRHGVGAAQPRRRLPPACLLGTGMERAQRVAKEAGEWPRSESPDRDPLPVPAVHRRGAAASPGRCSVLGKPRQPLLGVGRVQRRFCPLAGFPCGEDPCGAGQKEFRRKLGAGSWVGWAAWQDGCGGAGRSGMREQGRPGGEPPGTATATRTARELSLPGRSGSW